MAHVVSSIVLPLFGVMVVGFLVGRFGIMAKTGSAILGRFVFMVALPALAFNSLSQVPVEAFFDWPFLGALCGGMLATMLIGFAVARLAFRNDLTATGLHGLTAMFSSTGYIGLPLVLVAFGQEALVPGLIGTVVTGAVFLPIAIVLAEIARGRACGRVTFAPLLGVVRSPVLLATAAGLCVSALDITPPLPLSRLCELLADAFTPCALFSAGLFMSGGFARGNDREIGWLVFAKLVLHPMITWWLAYRVFALEGTLPAIAVLQAALPCGVPVFALAQQYGCFVTRSNAAIVISTSLSIFTLTGLLILYGQ